MFKNNLYPPPPKKKSLSNVQTKCNKSAKWHCGRHTLICKKILIKKT